MPKMKHIHRWRSYLTGDGVRFMCMDGSCKHVLSLGELDNALNAAERFTVQDALQILWDLDHAAGVSVGDEYEALEAYAEELEP